VKLDLTFFFDGITDLDVDNIIKPIADAIEGQVYVEDNQIVEVSARKLNQKALPTLVNPPPSVIAALAAGADFVYIEVTPASLVEVTFT
jgi:hypothetical protein